jgi:hypothetical protein
MKTILTFEADGKNGTYWDDVEKLKQILKLDDYKRLIFDFNEWLISEIKYSGNNIQKLGYFKDVQKQWIEFMNDRNINHDDIV